MNKQKMLERLYKQRAKLEDTMFEKGETPNRIIKLLELNVKIETLQEELNK